MNLMVESAAHRIERWSNLLGVDPSSSKARFWSASKESKALVEHRVLKQDVKRTRSDELFYNNSRMRQLLEQCLLCFCAYYRLEYMQGLNEILAPLLAINVVATPGQYDLINDPKKLSMGAESDDRGCDSQCVSRSVSCDDHDGREGNAILEDLHDLIIQYNASFIFFERIVTTLNPVIFSKHGIAALQAQLASFHNLLFYVDAELAIYLFREGMRSDVYAQAWFITLFLRRTPVELALYILDNLLPQHECPCFIIILAVALLVEQKQRLMHEVDKEDLPSLLINLNFQTATDVDHAVHLAKALHSTLPASMVRAMNAIGFDPSLSENARDTALKDLFRRPSMRISAIDVACRPTGVFTADIPPPDWSSGVIPPTSNTSGGARTGNRIEGEEEEEEDGEDSKYDLRLLPLANVIDKTRCRRPPWNQSVEEVTGFDLTDLDERAQGELGHVTARGQKASESSAELAMRPTRTDAGTLLETARGSAGTSPPGALKSASRQRAGQPKKTHGSEFRSWPQHSGYLLLDCRDPLASARREYSPNAPSAIAQPGGCGGEGPGVLGTENSKNAPCGHVAEDILIEGAIIVPPEVIMEVCEMAHKKGLSRRREGEFAKNNMNIPFDIKKYSSWGIVHALYNLLTSAAKAGMHIVLFDDGVPSPCVTEAEARRKGGDGAVASEAIPGNRSSSNGSGSGSSSSSVGNGGLETPPSGIDSILRSSPSLTPAALGLRALGLGVGARVSGESTDGHANGYTLHGASDNVETEEEGDETFSTLHHRFRESLAALLGSVGSESEDIHRPSIIVEGLADSSRARGPIGRGTGRFLEKEDQEEEPLSPRPSTTSNSNSTALATALLLLGFPRVSVMQGYRTDVMYGDIAAQLSTTTATTATDYYDTSSSNNTTGKVGSRERTSASLYPSERGGLEEEGGEEEEEEEAFLDARMRRKWFPESLLPEEVSMRLGARESPLLDPSDGVYALLYFLLFTDEGFTRLVDNQAPPPSLAISKGEVSVLSSISRDVTEVTEAEEGAATDASQDRSRIKPEPASRALEVSYVRRYLLKAPRLSAALRAGGRGVDSDADKYVKMIDRAVTVEHLKLQGKGPESLRRERKEEEEEEEGGEEEGGGSSSGPTFGSETWATVLESFSATGNSAVKAVLGSTNITTSLPTFGSSHRAGIEGDPSTPVRIGGHSGQEHTTPGVGLFGQATPAKATAVATPEKRAVTATRDAKEAHVSPITPVRTLQTSTDPVDAARLEHFLLLSSAKDKDPTSIARHAQDLRELHADISALHQQFAQLTGTYSDLVESARAVRRSTDKGKEEGEGEG